MKKPSRISRRYGGKTADGRKLVVYAGGRVDATRRLREAGVVGRVRKLGGRCVNGKLQLPKALSRGPSIDRIGCR